MLMDSVFPPFPNETEVANLNSKMEQLNIDDHTRVLQIKIEKAKQQKFGAKIKNFKKRAFTPQINIIWELCTNVETMRIRMELHQRLYER